MNKGEEKKIHEILESGSIGYAYLFDAKARKTLEKVVSLEPENLAALFRKYGTEMEWMSVTDMRDRIREYFCKCQMVCGTEISKWYLYYQ